MEKNEDPNSRFNKLVAYANLGKPIKVFKPKVKYENFFINLKNWFKKEDKLEFVK
jgi:hypothetical protein